MKEEIEGFIVKDAKLFRLFGNVWGMNCRGEAFALLDA